MGSTSHSEDIAFLDQALHRALQREPRLRFVVAGCRPPSAKWQALPVPADLDYPEFCSWLRDSAARFAFAVAPLLDTAFNRDKSGLKFLEYLHRPAWGILRGRSLSGRRGAWSHRPSRRKHALRLGRRDRDAGAGCRPSWSSGACGLRQDHSRPHHSWSRPSVSDDDRSTRRLNSNYGPTLVKAILLALKADHAQISRTFITLFFNQRRMFPTRPDHKGSAYCRCPRARNRSL